MIKNCTYVNLGIIVSLANYKLLLTIALPFSSYWTEWWIIKQCPKGLQANGFFPVWVCSCLFKLLLSLIDLSHLEQANGFSPVWVRSCLFKLLLSLNDLSHLEQANGFSCVGSFMSLQIASIFKWLFIFGAGKWFLSCVGPFMSLQIASSFK